MVHLMLMLALASAENMVAATPLREAIWWPTAASTQQSSDLLHLADAASPDRL